VRVELRPGDASAPVALGVMIQSPHPTQVEAFWSHLGLKRHFLVEDHASAHYEGDMRSRGFRFLTVQVRDVLAAHAELMAEGVPELAAPTRMGDVAVVSFVADPDGVPVEISQRASLVGRLPDL
jgi:Glyoxalase/Bleomycin resistance protein/Dioxygenase superfamily